MELQPSAASDMVGVLSINQLPLLSVKTILKLPAALLHAMRPWQMIVFALTILTMPAHADMAADVQSCDGLTSGSSRGAIARCVGGLDKRAWGYYLQERFELALQDCNRAVELDPRDHACQRTRGISLVMLGEYEGAIDPLNQAIAVSPANGYYYHSRAVAYANLGDWGRAIADYDASIKLGVIEPDNFYDRGRARAKLGDTPQAIADFTEAIRLDPEGVRAYLARAHQWNTAGAFDLALEDAERSIKLAPADAWAWWEKGNAELGLGRYAEAAKTLAQHARMEQGDLYGIVLAYLAYQRAGGDDVNRLRASTRGFDLNEWPGPVVRYLLGEVDADAVRAAGVIASSECDAVFYVGEALIAKSDGALARSYLERAERICSESPILRALTVAELRRLEL